MNKIKLKFMAGAGIVLVLMLLATWWAFHSHSIDLKFFTPAFVKEKIGAFGPWAFVIYIAVYIINTLLVFPPNAPISLSAGLLFGPFWGVVILMVSIAIGTSLAFFIARSVGQKFLQKYIKGKWNAVSVHLARRGFLTVFCLRLIPIIQFEIINYACGISKIRFKDFFLGTMLGMLPGAIIVAFLGGKLAEVKSLQDLFSPKILISLGVLFLFIAIPSIYFLKKKGKLLK